MNILFDLDGTLGNTLPLCIAAFRMSLEPLLNRTLSDEDIIEQFGPSEEGTIMTLVPEFYQQGMQAYLDGYQRLHGDFSEPFAGMPEILYELKQAGVFVGMVTGKGPLSTRITLDIYGLTDVFDVIKTGSETGPVKTQRFEEIIAETGQPRDSFLYVGDTPSDIDACRAAGIKIASAAWAPTAHAESLRQKNPDYLFTSIDEFRDFLRRQL